MRTCVRRRPSDTRWSSTTPNALDRRRSALRADRSAGALPRLRPGGAREVAAPSVRSVAGRRPVGSVHDQADVVCRRAIDQHPFTRARGGEPQCRFHAIYLVVGDSAGRKLAVGTSTGSPQTGHSRGSSTGMKPNGVRSVATRVEDQARTPVRPDESRAGGGSGRWGAPWTLALQTLAEFDPTLNVVQACCTSRE